MNRAAVKEMHRQVGDLQIDEHGVATRGLLVRHLVLPHGLAGTAETARFLAQEISSNTYLNVMAQYRPEHKAFRIPLLSRSLLREEFTEAVKSVYEQGLRRLARPDASFPPAPVTVKVVKKGERQQEGDGFVVEIDGNGELSDLPSLLRIIRR